jgi:ParB family chromosome partitioning protein
MQRKALGKGLSALMPEKPVTSGAKIVNLEIESISLNQLQPRKVINADKIEELASSISEKGVIQPIIVRSKKEKDGFELIAGERRLRAARSLGFTHVPAIIKEVEDVESLQLALIENLHREDLNPLEEAQAYDQLITEFGLTQEKIAQLVGKKPSSVSNMLRLLKLPEEIKSALRKGLITMGHARTILALKSADEQDGIFRRTVNQHLSVRELEQLVTKSTTGAKSRRKSSRQDPNLVALEEMLQRFLGTKVKIVAGRKRGKIVLEYYSTSDLERIINLLKSVK